MDIKIILKFGLLIFCLSVNYTLTAQDLFNQNVQYNIIVDTEDNETISVEYEVYFPKDRKQPEFFSTTSLDSFLFILSNDIAQLPKDKSQVLFYIHGMWGGSRRNFNRAYNLMTDAYLDAEQSDIGRIVSLKWPGNKMDYKKNKETLYNTSAEISDVFFEFIRRFQTVNFLSRQIDSNIDLIIHSLGNELFKEMMLVLDEEDLEYPYFEEIILAASDLEADVFETEPEFSSVSKMANRVQIYFSKRDLTLGVSKNLNKKTRMGLGGPQEMAELPPNVYYIDVGHIKDDVNMGDLMTGHSYYRSSPIVTQDMIDCMLGLSLSQLNRELVDKKLNLYKIIN